MTGDSQEGIVVVAVEGRLWAPEDPLPPIAPIPDPHEGPTLAPPEPVSLTPSPEMIVVRVEAELAAAGP